MISIGSCFMSSCIFNHFLRNSSRSFRSASSRSRSGRKCVSTVGFLPSFGFFEGGSAGCKERSAAEANAEADSYAPSSPLGESPFFFGLNDSVSSSSPSSPANDSLTLPFSFFFFLTLRSSSLPAPHPSRQSPHKASLFLARRFVLT